MKDEILGLNLFISDINTDQKRIEPSTSNNIGGVIVDDTTLFYLFRY